MKRTKILLALATLTTLLLAACGAGQPSNVTIPDNQAQVELLANPQTGLVETANRAGVAASSAGNNGADDGTADQGTGDVLVVPTQILPAQVGNDDGTADQGHGDAATTATPANFGSEIEFTGVITAVGNGFITINGQNVFIGSGTEVEGALEQNATVKVHVFVDGNGALSAREVEVLVTADGTVIDDNGGHHDGNDDGPNHDANDDHDGQSNSGSDDGSSSDNSGPGDNSGSSVNSGSGDNSGSSGSGSGGSGHNGGDDGSGHHGGNDD